VFLVIDQGGYSLRQRSIPSVSGLASRFSQTFTGHRR
jgi:hypothetical protein